MVRLSTVKTLNDYKIMQLSWIYDLNFTTSFSILSELDCIQQLASTLPSNGQVVMAVDAVQDYVVGKLRAAGESMPAR